MRTWPNRSANEYWRPLKCTSSRCVNSNGGRETKTNFVAGCGARTRWTSRRNGRNGVDADVASTFGKIVEDVGRVLDEHEVPWMVVGGLALGAWVRPRATKDIAVAVVVDAEVAEALEAALESIHVHAYRGSVRRAAEGGVVRFETTIEPRTVVDMLCAGTDFEKEALERRVRARFLGGCFWVATEDDLLIYKLIAGRPQAMADVHALIRAGAPKDSLHVEQWVSEWGIDERWARALATARRE